MVFKNLIIALVCLCIGLGLYFLGSKLSKENQSNGHKKTFADYHGEFLIVGVFFLILSFVNICVWLWLNFIVANR
jgi:cell division protein FtsW (lipid II flippase)